MLNCQSPSCLWFDVKPRVSWLCWCRKKNVKFGVFLLIGRNSLYSPVTHTFPLQSVAISADLLMGSGPALPNFSAFHSNSAGLRHLRKMSSQCPPSFSNPGSGPPRGYAAFQPTCRVLWHFGADVINAARVSRASGPGGCWTSGKFGGKGRWKSCGESLCDGDWAERHRLNRDVWIEPLGDGRGWRGGGVPYLPASRTYVDLVIDVRVHWWPAVLHLSHD